MLGAKLFGGIKLRDILKDIDISMPDLSLNGGALPGLVTKKLSDDRWSVSYQFCTKNLQSPKGSIFEAQRQTSSGAVNA